MIRSLLIRGAAIAALLFAAAAPAAALAGDTVTLRDQPVSHGATITLGDLFDGAEGAAAGVVVARAPASGGEAVLEASEVQMKAQTAGLDWSNPQGLHHIIVASLSGAAPDGRETRRRREPRSVARGGTLVYVRNILSGEILGASDLQWSDDAVAAADSPDDPSAVIGKAARWALRAGAPVEARELASPKVVRRGDSVDVAFAEGGVNLTLQGRAMGDAAVGDALQVMNTQSKKLIDTVASGPGQAVVGPAADALKAAAFAPDIRTASLP